MSVFISNALDHGVGEAGGDVDDVSFVYASERRLDDFQTMVVHKSTQTSLELLHGEGDRRESSFFIALDVLAKLKMPAN